MSCNSFLRTFLVLAGFATVAGCGMQPAASPTATARRSNDAAPEDHDHTELGPHGGHLIELGDEAYHAEILHDDETHAVSVYLLDGKAQNTVAIAAPEITIDVKMGGDARRYLLAAVDLGQGEGEGSFCFESVNEDLCHALDEERSESTLSVDIEGQTLTGEFAHTHDHHRYHDHGNDHEHGHDHADAAPNGHRR